MTKAELWGGSGLGGKCSGCPGKGRLVGIQGPQRFLDEAGELDAAFGLGNLGGVSGSRVVSSFGLGFAAEFRQKVATYKLENRVFRIFFDERCDDLKCLFVLLVVIHQVFCKVEAGKGRGELAFTNGTFKLADSIFLGTARKAHEKPQNAGECGECVHVIVVQTQAHIGIGERRVERQRFQEIFARTDTGAGCGTILAADAVETAGKRVGHSGVKMYFSRVVLVEGGFGE